MPELDFFYQENKDRVLLVEVDMGQFWAGFTAAPAEAREFLDDIGVTYPVGYPPDEQTARDYRIFVLPKTVFITKEGRVFREWTGLLTAEMLSQITDEMIGSQS